MSLLSVQELLFDSLNVNDDSKDSVLTSGLLPPRKFLTVQSMYKYHLYINRLLLLCYSWMAYICCCADKLSCSRNKKPQNCVNCGTNCDRSCCLCSKRPPHSLQFPVILVLTALCIVQLTTPSTNW